MERYQLLKFHMNPNPNYLFGHAKIAGLLASNEGRQKLDTYEKYVLECKMQGISHYSEECYNSFVADVTKYLGAFYHL